MEGSQKGALSVSTAVETLSGLRFDSRAVAAVSPRLACNSARYRELPKLSFGRIALVCRWCRVEFVCKQTTQGKSPLDRLVGSVASCALWNCGSLNMASMAILQTSTDGGHGAQKGRLFLGPSGGGTRTRDS